MSHQAPPTEGDLRAFGNHSELAREARTLTPRQMSALGASREQLLVLDVGFGLLKRLADGNDSRPLMERFSDVDAAFKSLGDDLVAGLTADLAKWAEGEPSLPSWLRRAGKPGYERFLLRFVGARRHRRLSAAFRADAALFMVMARRVLRWFLPLATASDACVSLLTPEQCAAIKGLEGIASSSLLEMLVSADQALTKLTEKGEIQIDLDLARPAELSDLPSSADELVGVLTGQVSEEAVRLIAELGTVFANKIHGARDAFEHSRDPVSQASNSLIELIDRILRDAFPPDEVLSWVDRCYPDGRAGMTHVKDGRRHPTKRAQALCFVYAGADIGEHSWIQELAASTLVSARTNLQPLKHADQGTDEEKERVVVLLTAVAVFS